MSVTTHGWEQQSSWPCVLRAVGCTPPDPQRQKGKQMFGRCLPGYWCFFTQILTLDRLPPFSLPHLGLSSAPLWQMILSFLWCGFFSPLSSLFFLKCIQSSVYPYTKAWCGGYQRFVCPGTLPLCPARIPCWLTGMPTGPFENPTLLQLSIGKWTCWRHKLRLEALPCHLLAVALGELLTFCFSVEWVWQYLICKCLAQSKLTGEQWLLSFSLVFLFFIKVFRQRYGSL